MTIPVSAHAGSLPLAFEDTVAILARMGFTHVDPIAVEERPSHHFDALADSGLIVSCVALGQDLPPTHVLDSPSVTIRSETVSLIRRQIHDAAYLGATVAYLLPGRDGTRNGIAYFTEACAMLAEDAADQMVQLCVEHFPDSWLDRAERALEWLQLPELGPVKLLLDVGHCMISREDPADIVRKAGDRLGYVHLDDNNGQEDLHWPLLTGKLTRDDLSHLFAALRQQSYSSSVALELSAKLEDPKGNLELGLALLEELIGG